MWPRVTQPVARQSACVFRVLLTRARAHSILMMVLLHSIPRPNDPSAVFDNGTIAAVVTAAVHLPHVRSHVCILSLLLLTTSSFRTYAPIRVRIRCSDVQALRVIKQHWCSSIHATQAPQCIVATNQYQFSKLYRCWRQIRRISYQWGGACPACLTCLPDLPADLPTCPACLAAHVSLCQTRH